MGDSLLVFADSAGAPRAWRLLSGGAVVGRGDQVADLPEARPFVRVVLAVPGTDVAIHWLELSDGLTAVQAAGAARLQLGDSAAEQIDNFHVSAGRIERGLTCIALVPAERLRGWIASARALAIEPDIILPTPLLLLPPGEGLVAYRNGAVPDYRGAAQAFSLEDDLAALVLGDVQPTEIGEELREAGLGPVLANPPINLRQGAFAKRREWAIDWPWVRRLAAMGLVLLLLSLTHQFVTILRTSIAADRYETQALQLRRATGAPGARAAQSAASFAPVAGALFDSVRETPLAQITQLVYQADGSLRASIAADSAATIDALRQRVEGRGMTATAGLPGNIGGRVTSELTIRRR